MQKKMMVGLVCASLGMFACGPDNNGENNGSTNGDTNGSTNGDTNGSTNGDTNGSTNGDTNGSTNGDTNGSTNGDTNGSTNGMTNNMLMGDCSRLEIDGDDDGTADRVTLARLDEDGNQTDIWQDPNADGAYELYIQNSYNAEGQITGQLVDFENDGTPDLEVAIEYDADGNETEVRWDQGVDGTDEFVRTQTYDADGQRTGLVRDGEVNRNTGQIVEAADGTNDYELTVTYFDVGKPELAEWDTDGDGTADAINTWTYDQGSGDLTEFTMDGRVDPTDREGNGEIAPDPELLVAADGTVDYRRFDIVVDADGNVTEEKTDGRLNVLTGEFTEAPNGTGNLATYTRNADGAVTRLEFDEDADGSVEGIISFTYDADGNMLERTVDGIVDNDQMILEAQDGTIDERVTQTFNADSQVTSYARDWEDDGTDEVTAAWEYDADGNVTHFEIDGDTPFNAWELQTPADGTPDTLVDQMFDAMGRQASFMREVDGAFDLAATWAYGACSDLE